MKYKITIEKIAPEIVKDREWEKLYDAEAFEAAKKKDPDVEQYGYRTKEVEQDVSRKVFEQTVEKEIDLKSVIDAINK